MDRLNINSGRIDCIRYEENEEIFEIEFKDGKKYQYFQVPKKVFIEFMKSKAYDDYFQTHIQNKYENSIVSKQKKYGTCTICGRYVEFNNSSNTCDDCYYSIMGDSFRESYNTSSELWGYTDGNGDYFPYND